MDISSTFVKYVIFVFNILCVVVGLLLIVFGSLMLSQWSDFKNIEMAYSANSISFILIFLGAGIFLIASLGCYGAIKEHSCMTMTYAIAMLVLLIAEVILVGYVFIEGQNLVDSSDKFVRKVWDQRRTDQPLMNTLQLSLKCCGYNSPYDYTDITLPSSCCGPSATRCVITDVLVKQGCSSAMRTFVQTNNGIIRYAGLAVAAVLLVAFIFGTCLANQIRNDRRRAHY